MFYWGCLSESMLRWEGLSRLSQHALLFSLLYIASIYHCLETLIAKSIWEVSFPKQKSFVSSRSIYFVVETFRWSNRRASSPICLVRCRNRRRVEQIDWNGKSSVLSFFVYDWIECRVSREKESSCPSTCSCKMFAICHWSWVLLFFFFFFSFFFYWCHRSNGYAFFS